MRPAEARRAQKKRDALKEKVDGMQGADDARTAELNKSGPWEKTRATLVSLKTSSAITWRRWSGGEWVRQPTFADGARHCCYRHCWTSPVGCTRQAVVRGVSTIMFLMALQAPAVSFPSGR